MLNKNTKNTNSDPRTQTQKLKKEKKEKKKEQIPLLEYESAKLQKYNLITRNEIQI